MRYLVTGGAGFIGSNIVKSLVELQHHVVVLDNFRAGNLPGRKVQGAEYHSYDIGDPSADIAPFSGVDVVLHCAAMSRVQYSIEHPMETMQANINGTAHVLEASRKCCVKRVVFASSSSVYGDTERLPITEGMPLQPKSPYGMHKQFGEDMCRLWSETYGLPTVSLRLFNVYGPQMDPAEEYALVMGKFLMRRRQGYALPITGDGEQTRDFTHVSDVVRAFVMASASSTVGRGEAINIGGGSNITINRLAALFGGPITYTTPRLEPRHTLADISLAKRLLGWEPTVSMEQGVSDLIRWHDDMFSK